MDSFWFLGFAISWNLMCSFIMDTVRTKSQRRMYLLRWLGSFNLPQERLMQLCAVASEHFYHRLDRPPNWMRGSCNVQIGLQRSSSGPIWNLHGYIVNLHVEKDSAVSGMCGQGRQMRQCLISYNEMCTNDKINIHSSVNWNSINFNQKVKYCFIIKIL